ncbi:ADP-ribosylglycohydrolase family protein [Rhodopseudomonas palustris]|uniref:protein-tyrosine-phosphatase n=1 Tax=Rhodopseudomonas palustris (strain BisB18) TaxID=316056 RepID=Q21C89_RHOPB
MRTSASHPLQIAAVAGGPGCGRVGLTFCPGKYDPYAASGAWKRDLASDLDLIRDWGAAAVVTLVEQRELAMLRVETLGEEVLRRQMAWFHLPIVDVSVPDQDFELAWDSAGAGLRAILRSGFDVVVHCRGGLGRAGTIAARLLAELGFEPAAAVREVRKARPGAIETPTQKHYVLAVRTADESPPPADRIRDRAIGALAGLAIGDAVGVPLEFQPRDSTPPLHDMIGGGPFRLEPGEWTDDTSMALCLADSLLACPGAFDAADLMGRFVAWWEQGANSVNQRGCFDIGLTTKAALQRWQRERDPYAGSPDPRAAGNGSLMRLSPVAIRFWNDRQALQDVAIRQSRTTHAAAEALEACALYAEILADAIEGRPRSQLLRPRDGAYAGAVQAIAAGSWRGKRRDQIQSSGYVLHSLEAALWCVGSTADFSSAVLKAANLGDDADTTAAIAGQLAGALYGASGIPRHWMARLAGREAILSRAAALFDRSLGAQAPPPTIADQRLFGLD